VAKQKSFVETIERASDACGCIKIIVKPGVKVITVEPAADALSVEEIYKLFSTAFEQARLRRFTGRRRL
jgi:hypothetical protein